MNVDRERIAKGVNSVDIRHEESGLHPHVFTADILETWITCKRKHEIDPVKLRPHSYESLLYYDA